MSFARPSRCRSPLQWPAHRDPPAASAGQVAERTPREAAGRQRDCGNCRSVRRQVCLNASSCHARARLRSTLRREFPDERDREAGGVLPRLSARRSQRGPLTALLSTPVIASGGIADGRTVAAAVALGADAVWVGTRLLASFETNAHPQYKDRVVAAGVGDTARHLIFGPEFPDASTRGLRNRIVQEWEVRDHPAPYKVVPDSELPVIGQARFYGQEFPTKRFCGFPPTPEFEGDLEEMSLLAGEWVGQTKRLMRAAGIIDEMINEAEALIRSASDRWSLTSPPALRRISQGRK
jgi:hypothetical protein